MPTEDEMSVNERRKYLKRMKERYVGAKRAERGRLLSEMEQVTGMHRKSLTRLMHAGSLERKKRTTPRPCSYGLEVERVIVRVWESRDYICAERLTPSLLEMAQHLARFEPLGLTGQVEEQLAAISRATVARILRKYRSRRVRLPQKGAERANQVTKGVPMGRIPWDIGEPGHFEVDLVHHCGESTAGVYGHTIQLIDVKTGWSERVAVLGRGQAAMEGGFRRIVERVPFVILELHPDNGSEFFNQHLVRYWREKVTGVRLSRSRPYQKNDNRMVEQKNDTLVRKSCRASAPGHRLPRWRPSMRSMSRCGSTTICFSPCCICVRKRWWATESSASGMTPRRPLSACWEASGSVQSSRHTYSSSMSRPIHSSCARRSTANWLGSGRRPPLSPAVRREGCGEAARAASPHP